MANCPNCSYQFEVEDRHLGTLYTCPSCNAVFFVNWSGEPEMANHADSSNFGESASDGIQDFHSPLESENMESDKLEATQYVASNEGFPAQTGYDSAESFSNQGIPDYSPNESENIYGQNANYSSAGDSIPNFESSESSEGDQFNPENGFQNTEDVNNFQGSAEQSLEAMSDYPQEDTEPVPYDFNQPLGAIPQPHQVVEQDPSNLSDIAEFANSNEVTSGLSYTIIIDGIENFSLVKALREAMEDSKFGWDTNGLLESIQGGRLVVKRLSPVKASIFIGRIKYLPLTISWKQEVLGG